jgi:CheY-like chemotaxis protein
MDPKKVVFVVDDSTITRLFIIDSIKDIEGIEIHQFVNGEQLINKLNETLPDLILLDSVMPIMDGFTALEKLRGQGIQVPVIICTADIQSTTKAKALSLGVSDFINKPIQKPLLLEAVKKILT